MSEPNRLIHEKSPYLLQHANNPIDWYPWSEEAFEKAKRENKLVFLSCGYSTCHWCHVMARESFADKEVAQELNRNYVSIKVDREERPDIDHIYMTVCQLMTGQGGWPLTVILTPDQHPIFAGTYFPKQSKWGRPGLMDILQQVSEKWSQERSDVKETGAKVVEAVKPHLQAGGEGEPEKQVFRDAFNRYTEHFDGTYGGFGSAPKFPSPHNLMFLLRYYQETGETHALQMVEKTLDGMFRGGLNDHIGYGFARYSTDEKWLAPHFEKMLYDNALLAYTYLETYQVTKKSQYAQVAERIFTYILRDMTDPGGAFYSAEDAESEGVEGKFYVWTPDEVKHVLGSKIGEFVCAYYDIREEGNFEGKSIPNLIGRPLEEFKQSEEILEEAREKLFQHREQRVHPHKDDKILTSWNGLMIAALAKGAKVLSKTAYRDAAEKAANFLLTHLRREDGRLLARYRDGEAAYPGYLDDYAFLVWGLHELYEATWKVQYLQHAIQLNDEMLHLFWDEERGGCYFTGTDSEQLLARPKELYDGAIPSGNSVVAYNLWRLAHLTGSASLEEKAELHTRAFAGQVKKAPTGTAFFLAAMQMALGPKRMIVIAGERGDAITEEMLQVTQQAFLPGAILLFHPQTKTGAASSAADFIIEDLAPSIAEQGLQNGKATAYVCENYACREPVTDVNRLREHLQ